MDAVFGSDGERGEAGGTSDAFGGALVDADIAVGHTLGVHGEDAGEEGVDGEVAAFDTVVESGEEGEVFAVRFERFEKAGEGVVGAGFVREELGADRSRGGCRWRPCAWGGRALPDLLQVLRPRRKVRSGATP